MISEILTSDYKLLTDHQTIQQDFKDVYATDLLSQAILAGKSSNLLITIISNANAIGVAMMMDFPGVIISGNKPVTQNMIDKANEENIAIIQTKLQTHEVIIDLFKRGLL